jgi:diguanylate cyclase (GGDEF)-like protein
MIYQSSTSEMVKELKDVKGVFNLAAKSAAATSCDVSAQQLMLEISMRLQMSLELEWVIGQFMELLHARLLFDGYRYQLERPVAQLNSGRDQGHQCSYKLSIDNDDLGSLSLFRGRKFADSELALLENLLCSLLYPLRNAIEYRKVTRSAHFDSLTGVNNRSTFDAALTREMQLAIRGKTSFAILVIDIDHFKEFNDTYGHSAGDEVLKDVALRIKHNIRSTDQLFRFGGEEFVVLLNDSDCEVAGYIANRVLGAIRESKVQYQQQQLGVSVSIGLACLRRGDQAMDIFNRADRAMYAAKNDGRDQVKFG